mmetsp:Transcript_40022/g.129045  ORF Transcript_40022/g.129045 Transcript_40022/m.129045 type:complete len:557 (-) Transcript_40022:235-1905(-)
MLDTVNPAEEPASQRVLSSIELVGLLLENVFSFRDRLALHATCRTMRGFVADPVHWRSLTLQAERFDRPSISERVRFAMRWVKAGIVRSLTVRAHHLTLELPARGCRLVELDIAGASIKDAFLLRATFGACGETLRRLDVTFVRILGHPLSDCLHGAKGVQFGPRPGIIFTPSPIDLFEPLRRLEVLSAYDTESAIAAEYSIVGYALSRCPFLTTLVTGGGSEFLSDATGGPAAATRFAQSNLCRLELSHALRARYLHGLAPPAHLTRLSLRGYLRFGVEDVTWLLSSTPPIQSLDLCGCRVALTHSSDHDGQLAAESIAKLAPTLTHLNVRGTGFDDGYARALAAAGARISRLNASCTDLTGVGLAALANASPQLEVLDLCYAQGCARDVPAVRAAVRRHSPGLRMLGLGGFDTLNLSDLRAMLEPNRQSLTHLGIGGCTSLDASAALSLLSEACPNLTALSAHKLPGVCTAALLTVIDKCPALRSLDVYDTVPVHEVSDCGSYALVQSVGDLLASNQPARIPLKRWLALGCERVGEHLGGLPRVIEEEQAVAYW